MDQPFDDLSSKATSPQPESSVERIPQRRFAEDVADRSMLVVQYVLAVIAVVSAILLSRAT